MIWSSVGTSGDSNVSPFTLYTKDELSVGFGAHHIVCDNVRVKYMTWTAKWTYQWSQCNLKVDINIRAANGRSAGLQEVRTDNT